MSHSRKTKNTWRRLTRLGILGVVGIALVSLMIVARGTEQIEVMAVETALAEPEPPQDYSRFRHDTQQHTRLPCLVCHVRSDNRAAMRYPGHIPCSSCHQDQFAQGNSSPMCYICHTETGVKAFPGLKSFNARFDHARHTKLANCATCHKPTRRGVALSIPDRTNAHTTCFQCHTPDSGSGEQRLGSCNTCHQPGRLVRTPETATAFNRGFSHAEHSRKGLSCAQCHTVRAGMGRGRQVSSPTPAMHLVGAGVRSCASCHDNKRAFGGNDFSDCKRCHTERFGF